MSMQREVHLANAVLRMLIHVAVGVVIFATIAGGALLLDELIQWATDEKTNPIVLLVLKAGEIGLILADGLFFFEFLRWGYFRFKAELRGEETNNG